MRSSTGSDDVNEMIHFTTTGTAKWPHPPAKRRETMDLVLATHFGNDRYRHADTYEQLGGYAAMRKAFSMPKEEIVAEVRKANLRGRGGAGFPAGVKWGVLPKDLSPPRVLVINADGGGAGAFKD